MFGCGLIHSQGAKRTSLQCITERWPCENTADPEEDAVARAQTAQTTNKAPALRALAFQIHRKKPPEEALLEHLQEQMQSGQWKRYKPAEEALAESGFVAALQVLDLVNDEAAAVLSAVVDGRDHRLLASALNALANLHDEG